MCRCYRRFDLRCFLFRWHQVFLTLVFLPLQWHFRILVELRLMLVRFLLTPFGFSGEIFSSLEFLIDLKTANSVRLFVGEPVESVTLDNGWDGGNGVYGLVTRVLWGLKRLERFFDLNFGRNRSQDSVFSFGSLANSCLIINVYRNVARVFVRDNRFGLPWCCRWDECFASFPRRSYASERIREKKREREDR